MHSVFSRIKLRTKFCYCCVICFYMCLVKIAQVKVIRMYSHLTIYRIPEVIFIIGGWAGNYICTFVTETAGHIAR
jgi:hypothetical protein